MQIKEKKCEGVCPYCNCLNRVYLDYAAETEHFLLNYARCTACDGRFTEVFTKDNTYDTTVYFE